MLVTFLNMIHTVNRYIWYQGGASPYFELCLTIVLCKSLRWHQYPRPTIYVLFVTYSRLYAHGTQYLWACLLQEDIPVTLLEEVCVVRAVI